MVDSRSPPKPTELDFEAAEKKRMAAEKKAAKAAESKRIAAEKKAARQAAQAEKKLKMAEEKAAKQAAKMEEKLRKDAEKAEKKRKAAEDKATGDEAGNAEEQPSAKKPKKAYVPREGTLAESYLIILLQAKYRHMPAPTKDELMAAVDQCHLTNSAVYNTGEGSYYDGWSSFNALKKREPGLVDTKDRGPMHCYLTPEGEEMAETLLDRAIVAGRIDKAGWPSSIKAVSDEEGP